MSNLIPIEYQGQRILLTQQLADSYSADEKRISENYSRNKDRYKEGKHFFLLQGEELKGFKSGYPQIADTLKFVSILFLWTEKGAWLHAKSLNTDKAWEAYESLVDDYYAKRENQLPVVQGMTMTEVVAYLAQKAVEQERAEIERKRMDAKRDEEIHSLQTGLETLTDNLTVVPDAAKVKDLINEFQKWTRIDFDQIYARVYDILLDQHGIDVKRRVNNERERIDAEYFAAKGKRYASKTLKAKVTGIGVMVRMGVLDKFHTILVGLLAKVKAERKF